MTKRPDTAEVAVRNRRSRSAPVTTRHRKKHTVSDYRDWLHLVQPSRRVTDPPSSRRAIIIAMGPMRSL